MRRRELIFAAIAAALLVTYLVFGAGLYAVVGPVADPTPTPEKPRAPVTAPRVPGSIAFALRGDIYLLRDGTYAPLTSEGRNQQPSLAVDGATLVFARREQIDGKRIVDGQQVPARLGYSSVVRKPSAGGPEEVVVDGLRQRQGSTGLHAVSWYLAPTLAPDGRRLAYLEDDGDGAADLGVIDLATRRRMLFSSGADLADPAWSPDGKTIATTTYRAAAPGILLWNAERPGVATRLQKLPEGEPYGPSYSADGKWLVYTLRLDGRNDVHAFELATGRDVSLTRDGRSWNGALSPDGAWVAFLRERGGVVDLYAMELAAALAGGVAREPLKLTRGEGIDGGSRPAWAR